MSTDQPQPDQQRQDRKLVYVVDDEAIIASTLALIIQSHGFEARSFTDSREALEAARTRAPDLLVSDVIMPELTGVELAIKVRQLRPDCKTIILSGQAGTVELLEKANADGHQFVILSKPIHPVELLAQLKKLH